MKENDSIAKRDVSLDYLRVIAMLMIVFDHIVFMRNPEWLGTKLVDYALFKPLSIIQYFGAFGVCIFFLLTGYLFFPSFNRKGPGITGNIKFTLRKLLGLWIPCICSFTFFFVYQKIIGSITPLGKYWFQFSVKDWIESATLISYFIGSYDKINITWFLIPLVIFYLFYAPLVNIRVKQKFKMFILWGQVCIIYALGKFLPSNSFFYALGQYSWFVTIILAGIILYQIKTNEISKRWGALLIGINYCITVLGLYLYDKNYLLNEPYLVSFVYAMIFFVMFPKLEPKENKGIKFIADISFSVYLLHMCVGSLTMALFENRIPYIFAVCISLSATFICSIVFCKFIEKPIRHFIRKL